GDAGPSVGESFRQAAARARRGERARSLYPRAGAAGADRTDDGERVGPGDACGARRGRRALAPPAPRSESLNPLYRTDRVSVAQGSDDRVQVREVVHLDVEVER